MNNFSFSGNISRNILVYLSKILPGVEKVIGIYDSDISGDYEIRVINKKHNPQSTVLFDGSIDAKAIQKLRKRRYGFDWIKPGDEPFQHNNISTIETKVFDELDKTILCLRVNAIKHKEANNVYFMYFNPNHLNAGVKKPDIDRDYENKRIIRQFLENALEELLNLWENDKKELRNFINFSSKTLDDYKFEVELGKNQKAEFGIYIINKINGNSDKQFTYTDQAIAKLRNYTGPLELLEEMIYSSTKYAEITNPDRTIISLDESMLRLTIRNEQSMSSKSKPDIYIKYADIVSYLDNYEVAVAELVNEGLEVKSLLVGQRLQPKPLKPAAISLSIKKRSNKIIYLMKAHRERWPLLRMHFKPIRNILKNEHDLLIEPSKLSV